MITMKLFVTRHGQSCWNVEEKTCGITDIPLSEAGLKQAETLAEALIRDKEMNQIKHIFVSNLGRARVTASYAERALGLKAIVDERLHEQNFGIYEGKYYKDPEFQKLLTSPFCRYETGESLLDVAVRAYSFLSELKEKVNDENTLIVCHGCFNRVVASYFASYTLESFRAIRWDNCELKCFEL